MAYRKVQFPITRRIVSQQPLLQITALDPTLGLCIIKATSDSGTYCSFLKPEVAGEMQADHLDPQKKSQWSLSKNSTEIHVQYLGGGGSLVCHQ